MKVVGRGSCPQCKVEVKLVLRGMRGPECINCFLPYDKEKWKDR